MWQPKACPWVRCTLLAAFMLGSLDIADDLEVAAWSSLVAATSYVEMRVNIWAAYLGQLLAAASPRATSFKCNVAVLHMPLTAAQTYDEIRGCLLRSKTILILLVLILSETCVLCPAQPHNSSIPQADD